ncbi:hypothetical protein EUGRSUZ_E00190 [Eucalyptus grandis]|uniref:Uncharacterized protein n=2 Tax=Eucalyptus grandis TaxID=71139 RepID=A0ACC3KQU5_EUCGR|nr:hypothetical protein EUGRSUZ_E00190 [Eucalyptus grandis]
MCCMLDASHSHRTLLCALVYQSLGEDTRFLLSRRLRNWRSCAGKDASCARNVVAVSKTKPARGQPGPLI